MKNVALVIVLSLLFVQCSDKKNSSQWRGPDRNGIYPEEELLKEWPKGGPKLLWRIDSIGQGFSSAAVTTKMIFAAGMIDSTGYIFAINHDGSLKWKKPYGPEWNKSFPGTRSTPTIYKSKGYIMSCFGVLYCFSTKDGEILWSRNLLNRSVDKDNLFGITENLIVDGNIVFCTPGGQIDNVYALNSNTGDVIWKSKARGEKNAYCSPILIERGGKKFYIVNSAKSTISLNAENGELAWSYELFNKQNVHANTPIYFEGKIFVMDGFESGSSMLQLSNDGMSVSELWKNPVLDETNGHSVRVGENLYISAESKGELCCVDWNTGTVKYSIKKYSPGTVIYADGMLYCYSYEGDFGLLEPTGKEFIEKGYFKLPKSKVLHISHPVINNGRLYIRFDKSLYVYSISNG